MNGAKRLCIQVSHLLLGVGHPPEIEESEYKGIEDRQSMRSGPFTDLTGIFGEGHVTTGMQAILNGPVFPDEFKEAKGIRLFRGEAGHTRGACGTEQGVRNRRQAS